MSSTICHLTAIQNRIISFLSFINYLLNLLAWMRSAYVRCVTGKLDELTQKQVKGSRTEILSIQDVNQPKKAQKGPIACDCSNAFIFSACAIGVKDGLSTVPLV